MLPWVTGVAHASRLGFLKILGKIKVKVKHQVKKMVAHSSMHLTLLISYDQNSKSKSIFFYSLINNISYLIRIINLLLVHVKGY